MRKHKDQVSVKLPPQPYHHCSYVTSVVFLCFCLLLFTIQSCKSSENESHKEALKILNSFQQDETLNLIWSEMFRLYHLRSDKKPTLVQTLEPHNLFYRIKQLENINSLPNLIYLDPNSATGHYLTRNELLQDLHMEKENGYLSKLPFSDLALVSQGSDEKILWVLPMEVELNGILFINDRLLQKEGLKLPETMESLEKSIRILMERGYEHPLVLGHNYNKNILNNLLGTLVGRYVNENFFKNALSEPELYRRQEFLSALQLYCDYLSKDGILPHKIRRLVYGEGLVLFNMERAVFLLGNSADAENFIQKDSFRNSISWYPLPADRALQGLEQQKILPGKIQPGYGITTITKQNPQIQSRAVEFLNFMFTDGIPIYAQYAHKASEHRIFSVPVQLTDQSAFYRKKQEFYSHIPSFIDEIQNSMMKEDYGFLEPFMEDVLKGSKNIDQVINIFYTNAIKQN